VKKLSPGVFKKRLQNIRMLVLDVDGILTDCRIFMDGNNEWRRMFSIRDGYGLARLKRAGFKTAVITGSKARDIQERVRHLKIDFFFEGNLEKIECLQELAQTSGLSYDQMAYMGDDDFDIPVLEAVGFAATVPEALEEVHKISHYITKRPAGNGAVREVCELLIKNTKPAKGKS
jgi:3-deoxy-D-manno-octulosonate 8-phosphate phosphatase (KDO 8-P phosphatase)